MRTSLKTQRGVSTLIMILAVGAALAASLYGAYSHMQASDRSQDTSSTRAQAQSYAEDALTASAEYFNMLFCGSPSATCASGSAGNLTPTLVPAGLVVVDHAPANGNGGYYTATVVNNTFATNGEIEVDAVGTTATGSAAIRAYLHAGTIYTFTPLNYAFLINGSQVLTGNVSINTGSSSLTVVGNLGIQGSASVSGAARATGSITDSTGKSCGATATCTQNIDASSVVSPSINTYNLTGEANAILSVDAHGNPQVTFANDPGLTPAGTTSFASFPASSTALCAAGGTGCIVPPSNNNGAWEIKGTPNPGVLFFYGDLAVASGVIGKSTSSTPGYATLIATGNVDVKTLNDIVAYGQMPNVCNQAVIPTNVCPDGTNATSPGEGTGPVANAVLLSGGSVDYPYSGGGTVYVAGAASTAVPPLNATTETAASDTTQPSGTVTGYLCTSDGATTGSAASCGSDATTSGIITGGDVTLEGNSDLTGVVAAGESLTARGTGTITGMIDTANTNNTSTSTLGNNSSTNDINGNLKIRYAPGVSNATNFGGGGNTPEMAFVPLWQRFIY